MDRTPFLSSPTCESSHSFPFALAFVMGLTSTVAFLATQAFAQVNSNDYPIDKPFSKPARQNHLDVERPNMILFMPDQLRFDAVGTFAEHGAKTPNIDAFAAEGVKFTICFAQASTCSQSRNSMFGRSIAST